jgi:hypothetical protein
MTPNLPNFYPKGCLSPRKIEAGRACQTSLPHFLPAKEEIEDEKLCSAATFPVGDVLHNFSSLLSEGRGPAKTRWARAANTQPKSQLDELVVQRNTPTQHLMTPLQSLQAAKESFRRDIALLTFDGSLVTGPTKLISIDIAKARMFVRRTPNDKNPVQIALPTELGQECSKALSKILMHPAIVD